MGGGATMIHAIFALVPWYWWLAGVLVLAGAIYLGLLPAFAKLAAFFVKEVWGAGIAIWNELPAQGKIAVAVIAYTAAMVGLHFLDLRIEIAKAVAEATAADKAECEKKVALRDAQWIAAEKQRVDESAKEARTKEANDQKVLAGIKQDYERKLANEKNLHDRDVAAARAGDLVLRFTSPATTGSSSLGLSQAAAGGGLGNGSPGCQLPPEVTANLFALADDADAVVNQLSACQQVILNDRKEKP